MTRLQYTCPGCGTPLGYEGLCWKCKSEQDRNTALAWTPEQVSEKQTHLIQTSSAWVRWRTRSSPTFGSCLATMMPSPRKFSGQHWPQGCSGPVRSIITLPPMWRDGLIHALLSTDDSNGASS